MGPRDYIAALKRQWAVVAVACLLTVSATAVFTLQQEQVYRAQAQLFVASGGGDDTITQAYQGGLFVQQRIRSYLQVATSPDVLGPAADQLDLAGPPSSLAGRIRVESPADTVLINVIATSDSPQDAADIANAVGTSFADYIEALEVREDQEAPPVKISVTNPAVAPASPVSPRAATNLLLGLVVGLALGIGLASVRELLDTALRSEDEISGVAGRPILGRVPLDRSASRTPLADPTKPSARAEAFRVLRTNLQYFNIDSPARLFLVTSSVPSEGKSITSANLAASMAQTGLRVLLIDCDLRRPRSVEMLGLVGGVGLTDVLVGRAEAADVIQRLGQSGIDVLGSGPSPPNPSELLAAPAMERLLGSLASDYDIIVLDAPPLLPVTDAAVLARVADGALIVVRYGKTTRDQLAAAVAAVNAVGAGLLGVVVNMIPGRSGVSRYGYYTSSSARSEPEDAISGGIPASISVKPAQTDEVS